MKSCKYPLLFACVAITAAPAVSAFTTSFQTGTFGPTGTEIAGKDGWLINDVGGDDPDPGNLSYSAMLDGSLGGAVGGFYDAPSTWSPTTPATVFLSNAYVGPVNSLVFSAEFGIGQSSETYPGRDGFGFSFRGAGVDGDNVFTVSFLPFDNDPGAGAGDAFQISVASDVGPTIPVSDVNGDPGFIFHDGLYSIELSFTPAGLDANYELTLTGSNSQTYLGTAVGIGNSMVERFGAEWNAVDAGDNFMVFDNVSVVPEPTLLSLSAFGLALMGRRRRI